MFHSNIIDIDLNRTIKEWSRQFSEKKDISDLVPLDSSLTPKIASSLWSNMYEFLNMRTLFSDCLKNMGMSFEFSDIKFQDNNRQITIYGNIEYGVNLIPVSINYRIKETRNLEKKMLYLFDRNCRGLLGKTIYEVPDGIAGRIIIGETDRNRYNKRLDDGEFYCYSDVMNQALAFVNPRRVDEIYVGSEDQIKKIKDYNLSVINFLQVLYFETDKQYISAFDFLDFSSKKFKESIHPKHVVDSAMLVDFFNNIKNMVEVRFESDYVNYPKSSGYSSRHLTTCQNFGFGFVSREIQFRIGWQHVFASHKGLAGHIEYLEEQDRKSQIKLLDDYVPFLFDLKRVA